MSLPPDQQQRTVEEIAASNHSSAAPTAPRGTTATYQPLERFIQSKYPHVKFTSDYRDPQHNKDVGGVEGSYHTTRQAVDMTGLSDTERSSLKQDLINAGVTPREFLFHDAGSGMHLHVAADHLPDQFLAQWGNHPAPNPTATAAPDRDAEITQAQAQATAFLRAGKEKEAVDVLAQHHLQIPDGELDAFHHGKRSAGFTHKDVAEQAPERSWLDTGREALKSAGEGAVDAVGGVLDNAPGALVMALTGNAKLAGDLGGVVTNKLQNAGVAPTQGLDRGYEAVVGKPEATTNGERYINAAAHQAGMFAVPMGAATKISLARRALATLTAGVGSGVVGEAAHDAAPTLGVDPDKARTVGQIVGGFAGAVPEVVKPLADARFVGKQAAKNPYASYDAEIAQDLHGLTTNKAKAATDPKGRAVVTVNEVNDLERSYTTGYKSKIAALDIPAADKRELVDALEQDHSISTDKLDALRGTPEGDAVATGIIKAQRLRALTPEIKRTGTLARLAKTGMDIAGAVGGGSAGGPMGAVGGVAAARIASRLVRASMRGGDAEAARVHAAERVIKRAPLYDKVAAKVGPSGQREAQASLNQKYADTVSAAEDAKASQAQDRADQQAQAASDRQAKADAKASRHGMTDKEYASYSARSASADAALKGDPVPSPRTRKAQSALDKYNKVATTGSSKLSDFDAKLNEAPQAPKARPRKAEDVAIENNMDQGIPGYHRAYADAVSAHLGVSVEPKDVLGALKHIKTDDIDPFELRKFQMEHRVSPAAKAALLPRLEKVLRADPKVMGRTAPAETIAAKPTKAAPTKASPNTSNYDQQAAHTPEVADPELRKVVRPADYERGTSSYIARADAKISSIKSDPEIPKGRLDEVVNAAESVKRDHKTKESARRWVDFEYLPQLESEGVDPNVIDRIQRHLHEVADVGKKHGTQAELDAATKRRPRGRPVKSTDDVPF